MPLGDSALTLGHVLRTRGLDGQLVVRSDSDEPRTLLSARRVLLDAEPGTIPYLVREAQPLGPSRSEGMLVGLRLAGLDSRARAEAWVGARVCIDAADLAPAQEGELYWRDLLGLVCRTRDGRELGVVEEIWPTPACSTCPTFETFWSQMLQSPDAGAGEGGAPWSASARRASRRTNPTASQAKGRRAPRRSGDGGADMTGDGGAPRAPRAGGGGRGQSRARAGRGQRRRPAPHGSALRRESGPVSERPPAADRSSRPMPDQAGRRRR